LVTFVVVFFYIEPIKYTDWEINIKCNEQAIHILRFDTME